MKAPTRTLILPYIADLRAREISGREVARRLGVTESWVSKTLKELGVERDKKHSRQEEKRLRQARLEHRRQAALTMSITEAAEACNVHPRTIKRLLATLPKAK